MVKAWSMLYVGNSMSPSVGDESIHCCEVEPPGVLNMFGSIDFFILNLLVSYLSGQYLYMLSVVCMYVFIFNLHTMKRYTCIYIYYI